MGRIRTIKPEFPQSESIGRLSRDARLLFLQLWTIVDDEGRARAASRMLASLLYPYDDDAPKLIDGWLEELEKENCAVRYSVDGTSYIEVVNWSKHQKVDHRSSSKFPPRPDALAKPREPSRALAPDLGPRTRDLDQGKDHAAAASPAGTAARGHEPTDLDRLEFDLRAAAGLEREREPGPAFLDLSPILGLIDAGFDVQSEILPVIRAKRRKGVGSWAYFVPMIHEARNTRRAAAAPRPPSRDGPAAPRAMRGVQSALAGIESFYGNGQQD